MAYLHVLLEHDHQTPGRQQLQDSTHEKMEWEGTLPMILHVTDAAEPLMEMMETMDSMNEAEVDDIDDELENIAIPC